MPPSLTPGMQPIGPFLWDAYVSASLGGKPKEWLSRDFKYIYTFSTQQCSGGSRNMCSLAYVKVRKFREGYSPEASFFLIFSDWFWALKDSGIADYFQALPTQSIKAFNAVSEKNPGETCTEKSSGVDFSGNHLDLISAPQNTLQTQKSARGW